MADEKQVDRKIKFTQKAIDALPPGDAAGTWWSDLGNLYIIDVNRNTIVGGHCDLEKLSPLPLPVRDLEDDVRWNPSGNRRNSTGAKARSARAARGRGGIQSPDLPVESENVP